MSNKNKIRLLTLIIATALGLVWYEFTNQIILRNEMIPDLKPSDRLYIQYIPSEHPSDIPKKGTDFLPTE